MALKISLLGAGSVIFAKTLLSDILQFPELSDATIALMDIDPARLNVARIMAERIVAKLGVRATIEATLDPRAAIRDANYVIVTVQVGGYEPGTVLDFEIPRKYGLLQTIGDTLGIGGIFRGLRTIPVINSFARLIAEVGAPNCLLLNYTNPMAMNCWAVDRAVGIPHVGLCHSVQGTSKQLASLAKLPVEDVTYLVAGINHMAFFLRFEYKRQDAYPLLFALLEDEDCPFEKVRFEMMRRTGYFVTESSEHQSEYVPYFIHHGEETIRRFDIPIDEYLRRCRTIMATWKSTEAELVGGNGEIRVNPPSHEYGSFIIHSRETNTARVVYGNVPNRNLITNLPEGCCVELPCLVNGIGLQPTQVGALPPQLAAICQTNINVQALTVEAALSGKREHIYHAAMLDPHTAATLPLDKIWSMCDELIAAHQQAGLLGEYLPTVRQTGRSAAGVADRIIAQVEPAPEHPLDENAEMFHFQVSVTNPTAAEAEVPLSVRSRRHTLAAAGDAAFTLRVPAGATVRRPFTMRRAESTSGNGVGAGHDEASGDEIELSSTSRSVFARGWVLRPRKVLLASSSQPAAFELSLAGFPAATGSVQMRGESLLWSFEVHDSQILPGPRDQPHLGSCVELFFDEEKSAGLQQVVCVPPAGLKPGEIGQVSMANARGEAISGASGTCELSAAGYALSLELPLAAIKCGAGKKSILFDVSITIQSLGDAHSGGRTSLSGSFDFWETSSHYARLNVGG